MNREKEFDDISEMIVTYGENAVKCCEPIYLMRNRRGERHDKNTESATVTYVAFEGKNYAVTCAHVAYAHEDGVKDKPYLIPTVWSMSGKGFSFREGGVNELAGKFRYVDRPVYDGGRLDVAIASLSNEFVSTHMREKNKEFINLDECMAPDWGLLKTCANFGFPNNKKTSSNYTVSAKLSMIVLELQSNMLIGRNEFVLASHIPDAEIGSSLSGHSGSLVYCLLKDGNLMPVGLLYEGSPGDSSIKKVDGSFYGPCDFQIHAFLLSAEIFRYWLVNLVTDDAKSVW